MIPDSSAIVTNLLNEAGSDRVLDRLEAADVSRVGAPTLVETSMVMTGKMGDDGRILLAFLAEGNIDVLSFTDAHWRVAQSALVRFGKWQHPAALNLGTALPTQRLTSRGALTVRRKRLRTDRS